MNLLIIIIIIIIFMNSMVLSKIRLTAGTCFSVVMKRCTFRRRAKLAVDSVDRHRSACKLFQVSGLEIAKFLLPAGDDHCITSIGYLLETGD